jgi:hypothetical protein
VTVIATLAGFGLPGAPSLPVAPLDPSGWTDLLRDVAHERIEGLLGAAVAAGALRVTDDQVDVVRQAVWGRVRVDLSLERELLGVTGALDQVDIPYRVLKGPAWAHTVYPDPSWRGFGDVDLLVGDEHWYLAIEVLQAIGARRSLPEIRPGFDRRFGKDATLVSSAGWEIDLHRTLVAGPFGMWVNQRKLLARSGVVTIGGVRLATLDADSAFVHACYNAALADDPPRLIAARDVCQMVFDAHANPGAVEELARQWRAGAVIARALAMASTRLGVELWRQPLAAPFARFRAGAKDRALMALYRGPGRGYTSQAAAVVAVRGVRERVAYLGALTVPQASYLANRGLSPLSHLRRGVGRLWEGR